MTDSNMSKRNKGKEVNNGRLLIQAVVTGCSPTIIEFKLII